MTAVYQKLKWECKQMSQRQAVAYIISVCEEHGINAGDTDIILGSIINKLYK